MSNWFVEKRLRTGGVDVLLGASSSTVTRVAQRVAKGGAGPEHTVCSTERLARRLRAGHPGLQVVVSPLLASAVLDLSLLPHGSNISRGLLPELLAAERTVSTSPEALIVHGADGWWVAVGPVDAGEKLDVPGLDAAPLGELARLLATVAEAHQGPVRLKLRPDQLAHVTTPLLDRAGSRVDLRVPLTTPVTDLALLTRCRPRLRRLEVELDDDLSSVARASLLASISEEAEAVVFYWNRTVDRLVRERILPQLALAFRAQSAFDRWCREYEVARSAPLTALTRCRSTSLTPTVVTTATAAPLQATSLVNVTLICPDTQPNHGQHVAAFLPGEQLAASTSVCIQDLEAQLLPYRQPPGRTGGALLRHLDSPEDLQAFLQDAQRARDEGSWIAPELSVLESECAWLTASCATAPDRVLFADEKGLHSSLRSAPLNMGAGDVQLALAQQAAELAERRGCAACPAATHCSRCPSVPRSLEAEFCAARAARPWLPAYVAGLRLRQRHGTSLRISGFPARLYGDGPPVSHSLAWLVAADDQRVLIAEVGSGRRVFNVQPWAGALVEALEFGAPEPEAVAAALGAGASPEQCTALLRVLHQ